MNTCTSQTLKNCLQSDAYRLLDSNIDRIHFRVRCLIQDIQQYWTNQNLSIQLSKMSERQLQDFGLNDPQKQIQQLGNNFNSIKAEAEMNKYRYLPR